MRIHKFGGSSAGTPKIIEKVIEIITKFNKNNNKTAVVVSAFQGVTDQLVKMGRSAGKGEESYMEDLTKLEHRHMQAVKELINIKIQSPVLAQLKMRFNELDDVLHGIFLVKEVSLKTMDFIMSFGERLSAYIIAESFKSRGIKAEFLDSREIIKTDNNFGNAKVNFDETEKKIKDYFNKHDELQIITGFIGSTANNETITLGRGGSDYTASIIGSALDVSEIEIWTDVDGVLTADPRKVKSAFSIEEMTFEEAMEMSHFGAKVIYPPTMLPAMRKNIPIKIKNTFNPTFEGTAIKNKIKKNNYLIKGISSIGSLALLRVEGSGLIGIAGISARLFGSLAREKISVILISQASSEHSICFAVSKESALKAKQKIEEEFALEIHSKQVEKIDMEENISIIAIVGENMKKKPGISARLFNALGKNNINVIAIAQGSSERNISVVIDSKDEVKALNFVHDSFLFPNMKTANLFIAGTGLIGGTLLNQIKKEKEKLFKKQSIKINVAAIKNTRNMALNTEGIDMGNWEKKLKGSKIKTEQFINKIIGIDLPNSIFVDCTASEEVGEFYEYLLKNNISIVSANKKFNSGVLSKYQRAREVLTKTQAKFLYETNVGAALPIISTINDLLHSGDEIYKIEAVLSGTLSYIFNNFIKERKFSDVVKEAKEKGYTEPDPRDDLNGIDFARKILILARETGLKMELKDIKSQNLIPDACRKTKTVEDFFIKLKENEKEFEKMKKKAERNNKKLIHIGKIENSKAEISLQEIEQKHPFYNLEGNDNIVAFTTERYNQNPLVIKGPGAGAEVTAAGVFADILRIIN